MVIGVIPGPKEPKLDINSLLMPLVKEMLSLWDGIIIKTNRNMEVLVRAALLCVGCDIPAARNVCGYVGHNGFRGCSRCLLAKNLGKRLTTQILISVLGNHVTKWIINTGQ